MYFKTRMAEDDISFVVEVNVSLYTLEHNILSLISPVNFDNSLLCVTFRAQDIHSFSQSDNFFVILFR